MYRVVCSGDKCHPPTWIYADRRTDAATTEPIRELEPHMYDELTRLNHAGIEKEYA